MAPEISVTSTQSAAQLRTRLDTVLAKKFLSREAEKPVKSFWHFQRRPHTYLIRGSAIDDGYSVVLDEASGQEAAINNDPTLVETLLQNRRNLDLSFRFGLRVEEHLSGSRLVATYRPKLVERMPMAVRLVFGLLVLVFVTLAFFTVRAFAGSSIDVVWLPICLGVTAWLLWSESRKAAGDELATIERFLRAVADGEIALAAVPVEAPPRT